MKKFILTVGPALLHEIPITEIHSDKNIYRINGAHGSIADIEGYIEKIRSQVPSAAILMDLPGNKVRTKEVPDNGIELVKGEQFTIPNECFNYPDFYRHLKPGMTAWANDSVFEFEVVAVDDEKITFLSKSDGVLINGKGVHVRGMHKDIVGKHVKHKAFGVGTITAIEGTSIAVEFDKVGLKRMGYEFCMEKKMLEFI